MDNTVSIKLNRDFRRLYSRGKSFAAPAIVLYMRKNAYAQNRLGITVSTKVGNAVVRNKVRRRLREIYRLNENKLKIGLDIVIVARNRSRFTDYKELEVQFFRLCDKLDILA